jgi:hypothetical protein
MSDALANFAGASLNGLSLCCTPIELHRNDGADGVPFTASGFFWLRNGQPHLVTNWHVVSGRNLFTDKLGPTGFIPQKISFYGLDISAQGSDLRFQRTRYTIQFNQDLQDVLEKPPLIDGQPVDVWAAPIAPGVVFGKDSERKGFVGAAETSCFVNEHLGKPIVTRAGDDCFILGYPLNNSAGLRSPIWKRGSIASDTNIGVDGRPIFFVDAAVTRGMSGSPIFRRAVTVVAHNRDIDAIQEYTHFEFIGIYAGHLECKTLEDTNIGYGWYRTLIDRVASGYGYSAVTLQPTREPL